MTTARLIAALISAVLAVAAAGPVAGRTGPAAPEEAALVKGNSEFAFDLYARLHARDGNLFLSPYSISSALAMTYTGARGPTASQMARALRFPGEGAPLHRAFPGVFRDLGAAGPAQHAELHVANALWPQAGFPIAADFQATVRNLFGAGLRPLDFTRAPERARTTINGWVEQQTRDRIKDLIPEGMLTPATRLVLTNAIYFKGTWMQPFAEALTRKETFTLSTGQKIGGVPLMHQRGQFRYLDGGTFQALDLPYQANELSMIVLLPARTGGLAELERALAAARLADWLDGMTVQQVDVVLPRFKLTAAFELTRALTDLGMSLAFIDGKADFSGIAKGAALSLSAVVHKAYVQVDEKGTEAAAATAVAAQLSSARVPEPKVVVFRADHPFVFVIRDNRTGSLLFVGRVAKPHGG